MSERIRVSRGRWFDVPIVLVAIGWVAIWLLWPSAPVVGNRPARTAPATFGASTPVALHERPDLHVLPRIRLVEERAGFELAPPLLPPPRLRMPVLDLTPATAMPVPPPIAGIPSARVDLGVLVPVYSTLQGAALRTDVWHVWLSPGLQQAGLVLPIEALTDLPDPSVSFEVACSVSPSVENNVLGPHIFLERTTGTPDLDRALVKIIRQALEGVTYPVPHGTVVISRTRASSE